MFAIGIDVGATWTRAAAVDGSGRIVASHRDDTPRDADGFARRLVEAFDHVCRGANISTDAVTSIGLALPGIVDRDRGCLVRSVNLPFLEGVAIVDHLARAIGRRPALMTDAQAATWGEYSACSPRPERFAHLRLGTGIACGVVCGGRLAPSGPGRTTHWDVLIVDDGPEATPCPCGLRGCLETVASGRALEQHALQMGLKDGLDGLRHAWYRRDPRAVSLIDEVADALVIAITNLARKFQPQIVTIGGGAATALPCVVEEAIARSPSTTFQGGTVPRVEAAKRGDEAGVIGAALLADAPRS
jgi:glucokinase